MPPKPKADQVREWTTPVAGQPSPAKQWRRDAGLTAAEAARAVGVAERTLVRWEGGQAQPQGRNVDDYHRFLNRIRPREGEDE